jgi:molybdopterin-guanine dinucleotide biosynthesis protein B
MISFPLPLIGFSAFSGTGKTTLLTQVLPLLKQQGLRVGAIKHAHHDFEVDYPNKDSYRLRKAGADQMLVASRHRIALITERDDDAAEPELSDLLKSLDTRTLDLVLVEGYKREHFPKIELHRPSLGKKLLYPEDPNIIAIATDERLSTTPCHIPVLDLNSPADIVTFLLSFTLQQKKQHIPAFALQGQQRFQ